MSGYNPLFAQDQTAWLFEIGQKLRVAYDDIAEPVPPHLTALLKVLEIAATETSCVESVSLPNSGHWCARPEGRIRANMYGPAVRYKTDFQTDERESCINVSGL
jgi:hypothetical protein